MHVWASAASVPFYFIIGRKWHSEVSWNMCLGTSSMETVFHPKWCLSPCFNDPEHMGCYKTSLNAFVGQRDCHAKFCMTEAVSTKDWNILS